MPAKLFLFFLSAIVAVSATIQPSGVRFKHPVKVKSGLRAQVIYTNLTAPRGVALDSAQNVLVVERGVGVSSLAKVATGWDRKLVIADTGVTGGISLALGNIYVTTASDMRGYAYNAKTRTVTSGPNVVVSGLPSIGELTTHGILIDDSTKNVWLSSGPSSNIDLTARDISSGRSQIKLFTLNPTFAPQTWKSGGGLVAYGIRNPAAFALGSGKQKSKLWVVEDSTSIDALPRFTAAFANDNPADELNLVNLDAFTTRFYGFPDCATLWNGTADRTGAPDFVKQPRGAQFSLGLDADRDDPYCRNSENNVPPSFSFQAHSVPLDIKFYGAAQKTVYALSAAWVGDAFISFHGSFNRKPPAGYGIARLPFNPLGPTGKQIDYLIQAEITSSCPEECLRPVGIAFGTDGRLYASSDSTGEVFFIETNPKPNMQGNA